VQVLPGKRLSYALGIFVSLSLFSFVLLIFGYDPIPSLETLIMGPFGSVFNASETFVLMAPLLLSSLAFLVAFKGRFYNIGVEGQLYIGALSAYIASSVLGGFPSLIAVPIVAVAASIGGTLWLALPLFMRIKLQVNEVFATLIMNFIAIDIINWLTTGPIKDVNSVNPQTPFVPSTTWLAIVVPGTRFNLGVIIAILAAFVMYLIIHKTVLGYEIRASGLNPRAAQSGGVDNSRSILAVGLMSGSLAGLAGMVVINGANHLLAQNFSPGYGYQGIAVAALGDFHPVGALFASILYSALAVGGESMQRLPNGIPIELTYVLQVTIVLAVLLVQKWLSDRRRR